jgi:hypothetical protein
VVLVGEPLAELDEDEPEPELDPELDCGDPSPLVWLALTLGESGNAVTPVPLVHELGTICTVGDEVNVKSAHWDGSQKDAFDIGTTEKLTI